MAAAVQNSKWLPTSRFWSQDSEPRPASTFSFLFGHSGAGGVSGLSWNFPALPRWLFWLDWDHFSRDLAEVIFWSKSGKTPRLPVPVFQLLQNVTLDRLSTSPSCSADTLEPIQEASPKTRTTPHSGTFRRRRDVCVAVSEFPRKEVSQEESSARLDTGPVSSSAFWVGVSSVIACISKSSSALILTAAKRATPGIHTWSDKIFGGLPVRLLTRAPSRQLRRFFLSLAKVWLQTVFCGPASALSALSTGGRETSPCYTNFIQLGSRLLQVLRGTDTRRSY